MPPQNQSAPADTTSTGPSKNVVMAVLSYIGPLVIVSFLTSKDDPFVKFHIKQGLVLFVIEVALSILFSILWFLAPLWMLVNLAVFILSIVGIVHAAKGAETPLPIVGQYSRYFTF